MARNKQDSDAQTLLKELKHRNILLGGIEKLRPAQDKALKAGLLDNKNLLICTPTASGKTLIAEIAALKAIESGKTALYIVPLKALAMEKFRAFNDKYNKLFKVAVSIGDTDQSDGRLQNSSLSILTSEKLDSLLRNRVPWIKNVGVVIVDEIHLLNDHSRGPTLEIVITILRNLNSNIHILGLSATIGNPKELAGWLDARLVEDDWRPVKLEKGVYQDGKIFFPEDDI
ncbi:DEAD/DEAH box helicase [Candidatus Woesearchaeota archaeon]|nr:DEAD/DEAH box helicase [Candidatus Woesearchaeota archaeon]